MADQTSAAAAIRLHRWAGPERLRQGRCDGVSITADGLTFAHPTGDLDRVDPRTRELVRYETAGWTGPYVHDGFAPTELIPSWTARTPGGSAVRVELSGHTEAGTGTRWYHLGDWAADDDHLTRSSTAGQRDADGRVDADIFRAAPGHALARWRLRVTLMRPAGTLDLPVLHSLAAVASALPAGHARPADPALTGRGILLDVPRLSQRSHIGEYPQWGGGGESWCSPTAIAMVLAYWGTGPTAGELGWVDGTCPAPQVAHAARHTFDHAYGGCGNWPFNTAYAGRFGVRAFVTRLRSLREAELFLAAGIPLIVSAAFRTGEVPGLDYDTGGHLMVLAGFTAGGDPVLNDPNGATDARVRRPVGRAGFERAWQGSGGVVYVLHPPDVPLPAPPAQANW